MTPFDITRLQPKAWSVLARSHASGRLASTYLFHGPEGRGQWYLALSLAALLNCEHPQESEGGLPSGCGSCRACRLIYAAAFEHLHVALPIPAHKNLQEAYDLTNQVLDRLRKEPFHLPTSAKATGIPVAIARDFRRELFHKAPPGVRRIVLFYQMHKMQPGSADALLKVIEEPPADAVIILTATRPEALLPTVQSRAQKIKLDRVPEAFCKGYLGDRYGMDDKQATLLARICDGSLGRAVEMAAGGLDDEFSRRAVGFMIFKSLVLEPAFEVMAHMNELLNLRDKGEAEQLLALWQSLVGDCHQLAVTQEEKDLVNVDFSREIQRLASHFSDSSVAVRSAEHVKLALADLRLNTHILGTLMALVIRLKGAMRSAR